MLTVTRIVEILVVDTVHQRELLMTEFHYNLSEIIRKVKLAKKVGLIFYKD